MHLRGKVMSFPAKYYIEVKIFFSEPVYVIHKKTQNFMQIAKI